MTKQKGTTLKHPLEMYLLAISEACQRYAFWGGTFLLVLYLVEELNYTTPQATMIYGIYTGLSFLFPIFGGYLGDRWNYRHPVILGMIIGTFGYIFLAMGSKLFLAIGLGFIILGNSLFTPSIYALLGNIYTFLHHKRETGFSIYYSIINLGVFTAMISLGYLAQIHTWPMVFLVAACVQLIGIIPFIITLFAMKHDQIQTTIPKEHHHVDLSHKFSKHEKDRMYVILILTSITILYWICYNQIGSSLNLFAYKFTNRIVEGRLVPASWLLSFESLFLVILGPPLAGLYFLLRKLKTNPNPIMKTALSFIFMALAFFLLIRASDTIPEGATRASVSPFFLIFAFILIAISELLIVPIALSLLTNLAHKRYTALLVGVWYFCVGIGFYLGGIFAGWMPKFHLQNFFTIFLILSIVPAIVLACYSRKLNRMRHTDFL